MIIQCKSCQKSFNVPDNAIGEKGRLVQCSSCGNKWNQLPVKIEKVDNIVKKETPKITKQKNKKKVIKKRKGPTLYSEEYLKIKHGILLDKNKLKNKKEIRKNKEEFDSGFGFYKNVLFLLIFIIFFTGVLNLSKEIIIFNYPFLETYINYFYDTLNIFKTVILDFISY